MPDSSPLLPLATIQSTLGSPARWAILRELADGGSLMVSELAKRTGCSPSSTSKQLAVLIEDGLVINPRGRLFEIPERFVADKSNRTLDLGWCLLRMNVTQP